MGRIGKVRELASIVNDLGIATTIIVVGLALIVAVAFGKIKNPLVTGEQFETHANETSKSLTSLTGVHESTLKEQKLHTEMLGKVASALEKVGCKLEKTADAKEKCFDDLSK